MGATGDREEASPPIRVGILGAARIVRSALLGPASRTEGIEVVAVASRDRDRADAFARKRGIPSVAHGYQALIDDDTIDAVYVPLPAALHAERTIAAAQAGKHVLVEKPFTSNARTAAEVAAATRESGVVVMEAYHSHYHPLQTRLRALLASGVLGPIRNTHATFCVPIPPGRDIRWNKSLGGGGLLDVGYYPLRQLRELFAEPNRILHAAARDRDGIDRHLEASLVFPGDVHGTMVCSIWSPRIFAASLTVRGDAATARVSMPYHPQAGARLRVSGKQIRQAEHVDRISTYDLQLRAFRDAIRTGTQPDTDSEAAVRQLRVIDDIYTAAGLEPRPGSGGVLG